MEWSISGSATFARCPRQWYFRNYLANANAIRVPLRRKAYELSKLDSIWAWRGKIVDRVISRYLIPGIRQHRALELDECLAVARRTFERQLAYGISRGSCKVDDAGSKPEHFTAFYAIEYGQGLTNEEIAQAWADIAQALTNFLNLRSLLVTLESAKGVVIQRSLRFALNLPARGPVMIRATPDVIIFFEGQPPLIVDWKVRSVVAIEARIQLAVYALALIRGQLHKDFPDNLGRYGPKDVQLLEVRLLEGAIREYAMTDDDFADLETYVFDSASQMQRILNSQSTHELRAEDFPTTRYPNVCERCSFRAICWEDPKWRESSQTSFEF